MNGRRFLGVVLLGFFPVLSQVHAQNLKPGEYACSKPGDFRRGGPSTRPSAILRGRCRYQARNTGDQVFSQLIQTANAFIKDFPAVADDEILRPRRSQGDNTIEWWLGVNTDAERAKTDKTYILGDIAEENYMLGEYIKLADVDTEFLEMPTIAAEVNIYAFEKGFDWDFGLELASHFGKNQILDQNLQNGSATFTGGLFTGTFEIGNPLASFFNLALTASMDTHRVERVVSFRMDCEIGTRCGPEHLKTQYFVHSLGVEKQQIGISVGFTPRILPSDQTRLQFQNLVLEYSIPTGEENSPVDQFAFYQGRDIRLYASQMRLIGMETSTVKGLNGKLIGIGGEDGYKKLLITIQAEVKNSEKHTDRLRLQKTERQYTPEDLEALRTANGKQGITFKEALGSIEPICFDNPVDPSSQRSVCGFWLTKMDPELVDTIVTVEVLGSILGPTKKKTTMRLGDLYRDKGYFPLPKMEKSGTYVLSIKLPFSGPAERKKWGSQLIKGIYFDFGFHSDLSTPVSFDRDAIHHHLL